MKQIASIVFVNVLFLLGGPGSGPGMVYAQTEDAYYARAAGDSAMYLGKTLSREDLNKTVKLRLGSGLYRIVFNKLVPGKDVRVQVTHGRGEKVPTQKHNNFVDFRINSLDSVFLFLGVAGDAREIGRLFLVYEKNINKKAAPFALTDIYGRSYSNETLKGKIVVMNFWGIYCGPCRAEIPRLNEVVEHYRNRPDVVFIAVSDDSKEQLEKFVQEHAFTYKLVSKQGSVMLGAKLYDIGMYSVPAHIVLDKNGRVVFRFLGDSDEIVRQLIYAIDKHG